MMLVEPSRAVTLGHGEVAPSHSNFTGMWLVIPGYRPSMATRKQTQAAKKNIKKATEAARQQRSLANLPPATKTALGKQGAAVSARKRTGSDRPKTRQERDQEAKRRNIHGRSTMGRDELARVLGHG